MALKIAAGITFAEHSLQVEPVTDRLLFLPPLGRFCLANGLDPEHVLADQDQPCELICNWSVLHREDGGASDAAVESILRRVGTIEQ